LSGDDEAFMPPAMVRRVFESASPELVLVGGQALAFWAGYYDVPEPGDLGPAISRDVDFFTSSAVNSAPLKSFARAIGGRAFVQPIESLTALVGSAMAPAADGGTYNVDLIHQVFGLDRAEIEAHAVEVALPDSTARIRVLHPVHVLQSRNANLHKLSNKRDEIGCKQFALSITVARAYLEDRASSIEALHGLGEQQRQRAVLSAMKRVIEYAGEDAARKNAQRHGLHLADAIPAWRIRAPVFWEHQWPHLRQHMSPAYAAECERNNLGSDT
jgi:hypothetical protein